MKRALVAASALAILAGVQSFAQTVGVGPGETVVIEPEQRTVIREYVVKERVAPVTVKERLSVGATLPADVELRTAPSAWGLSILMTTCTWSSRLTVGSFKIIE